MSALNNYDEKGAEETKERDTEEIDTEKFYDVKNPYVDIENCIDESIEILESMDGFVSYKETKENDKKIAYLKAKKNILVYTFHKYPNVFIHKEKYVNLSLSIDNVKKEVGYLYGDMQAGKTGTAIAICLLNIACGNVAMFGCFDSSQMTTLKRDINDVLSSLGINIGILEARDVKQNNGKLEYEDEIVNNFYDKDFKFPKIVLFLAKEIQYSKMEQSLRLAVQEASKRGKYMRKTITIIDEAHSSCYSTCDKKVDDDENKIATKYTVKPSKEDSITRFFDLTDHIVCTSATGQRLLYEGLNGKGVNYLVQVKPGKDYVSFYGFNHSAIKTYKGLYPDKGPELIKFVDNFCNKVPSRENGMVTEYGSLPLSMAYVYTTSNIDKQLRVFELFNRKDACVVLNSNSKHFIIGFPSEFVNNMVSKEIKVGKKTYPISPENKINLDIKHPIRDILDVLDNHKDLIKRIVIVASKCQEKGVNCTPRSFNFHITDSFIDVPKSMTCDAATQLLRMSGYTKYPKSKNLYTPFEIYSDIIKSNKLNEACIKELADAFLKRDLGKLDFEDSIDYFKTKIINNKKIPKRREFLGSKSKPRTRYAGLTKGEDDLAGTNSEYWEHIARQTKLHTNSDLFKMITGEKSRVRATKYNSEFERLTKKMFPKWAKSNTKIARFMQNLDPLKTYTLAEIKEEARNCELKFAKQHFTEINLGNKSKGNGKILEEVDGNFKLRDELLESFKIHFNHTN